MDIQKRVAETRESLSVDGDEGIGVIRGTKGSVEVRHPISGEQEETRIELHHRVDFEVRKRFLVLPASHSRHLENHNNFRAFPPFISFVPFPVQ